MHTLNMKLAVDHFSVDLSTPCDILSTMGTIALTIVVIRDLAYQSPNAM